MHKLLPLVAATFSAGDMTDFAADRTFCHDGGNALTEIEIVSGCLVGDTSGPVVQTLKGVSSAVDKHNGSQLLAYRVKAGGAPTRVWVQAPANTSAGAESAPKMATFLVDFADFADLAAGVKTKDYTFVLPANARIMGLPIAETFTGFDDATHGTFTAVLGTSAGGNQVGTSLNIAVGQTGFPKKMSAGASAVLDNNLGGSTLTLRVTSSVDLNTATAGHIVVKMPYYVAA